MLWLIPFFLIIIFIIGILIAAKAAFEFGEDSPEGKVDLDKIRNVAAVVSAGAALSIPVVIGVASWFTQLETTRQLKETETLRLMNEVDIRISEITARKAVLNAGWSRDTTRTYEYIAQREKVQNEVRQLLNVYEFVCVGVNRGLLDKEVVKMMRMDALVSTFRVNYRRYIKLDNKNNRSPNSWSECIKLAKELEPEVRKGNRHLAADLDRVNKEEQEEKGKEEELERQSGSQGKPTK